MPIYIEYNPPGFDWSNLWAATIGVLGSLGAGFLGVRLGAKYTQQAQEEAENRTIRREIERERRIISNDLQNLKYLTLEANSSSHCIDLINALRSFMDKYPYLRLKMELQDIEEIIAKTSKPVVNSDMQNDYMKRLLMPLKKIVPNLTDADPPVDHKNLLILYSFLRHFLERPSNSAYHHLIRSLEIEKELHPTKEVKGVIDSLANIESRHYGPDKEQQEFLTDNTQHWTDTHPHSPTPFSIDTLSEIIKIKADIRNKLSA